MSTTERVVRRRTDPVERRAALLGASVRAIRRLGADASMSDIAAEAGVSKPTLYECFGDKAGLATALADHFLGDLDGRLAQVFGAGSDLRGAVHDGIAIFVSFAEREPELFRFLIEGSPGTGREMVEMPMLPGLVGRLTAFLVERTPALHPARARTWAVAVLGMVFSATGWWLDERSDAAAGASSRDDLVADLTDLVCRGLDRTGVNPRR